MKIVMMKVVVTVLIKGRLQKPNITEIIVVVKMHDPTVTESES